LIFFQILLNTGRTRSSSMGIWGTRFGRG